MIKEFYVQNELVVITLVFFPSCFMCGECKRTFTQNKNLFRHMKNSTSSLKIIMKIKKVPLVNQEYYFLYVVSLFADNPF